MAITTLDGALAGMQPPRMFYKASSGTLVAGRPFSFWASAGIPGAGSIDLTTNNGITLSSTSALVNGQLPHYNPNSGNSYLGRFAANSASSGTLILCDRLWQCGWDSGASAAFSPTKTTAQTVASCPTWPARDANGATAGVGVQIGIEVQANMGAGTPTATINYTNSDGTASRSATNVTPWTASPVAGSFHMLGLQAGDVGVKSVQSITMNATQNSGQWNLVAFRQIAQIEIVGALNNAVDVLTSGFPQLFNGVVPFLVFAPTVTTALTPTGQYLETQG